MNSEFDEVFPICQVFRSGALGTNCSNGDNPKSLDFGGQQGLHVLL